MNRLSKEIQQSLIFDRKSIPVKWTLQQLANLSKQHTASKESLPTNLIGSKRRPCKEFSQTLIQDIRIRLSKQHGMCLDIINQGKELMKSSKNEYKQMLDLEILHADTYLLLHQISKTNKNNQLSDTAYDKLLFSVFEQIRSRHALTLEPLSDIISSPINIISKVQLDELLRRRLSIQLLCDHYVWHTKYLKESGAVYVDYNFLDLVSEAIVEARHICDANVGFAPDVNVHLGKDLEDDVCLTLIRTWTYHSLIELLKNAMSSTVQKYQQNQNKNLCELPCIDIHIAKDKSKQILCSIIDKGTGIKSKPIQSFFEFACTKHWDRLQDQHSYAAVRAPLQGLGVGLNQSQMMMQMFGGDVLLCSNDASSGLGAGCTATLVLPTDTSILEYSIKEG